MPHSIDSISEILGRRTEAFECFTVHRRELGVSFEAGQLRSAGVTTRSGVGMRVVAGGRIAIGGTGDPTAVDATIDSTIESAAFGDKAVFDFAPPADAPDIDIHDPAVAGMEPSALVETGRRILAQLEDLAADATISVNLSADCDRTEFVNSPGQRFGYERTSYGVSISVSCFGADDIFRLWESDSHCRADGVDVDELVAGVRRRFEQARRVVPAGNGNQPIIFTPHGLNALLAPLLIGLNGENVADGISPLGDKMGEAILDPRLTLVDDGTLAGRCGTQPFDDEGVPSRRTVLLDGGRVNAFLVDLRSADELGTEPLGNASRSLTGPPGPGESNTILQPGDTPLEQMLADVGEGLLVDYLMGVGQGNLLAGDFANSVGLGFKIKDGQIAGRVKNLSISGNIYRDLRTVSAIEDRGHWFGSVCLPHVRIDNIRIATGG